MLKSIRPYNARLRGILPCLLVFLFLTGCGGGGGGGGGSAGVNDVGGTTPTPPAVSGQTLTLSGVVTDEPIANAEITIRIGGEEFTTTADASGAYEITITLTEGEFDPSTLVEITARGVGAQENVELIAIVGTIGALIEAAGDDETLSSAEDPRLNVTHVSTARFLLAIDASGGTPPADLAALEAAELATDIDELIELAALIKLIVDEALIPVPDGETTASLLRGSDEAQTVLSAIAVLLTEAGLLGEDGEPSDEFQTALDEAIAATIDDPSVRSAFDAASLLGLSVWTLPTATDWVPNFGDVFELAEDGTGVAYEDSFAGVFTVIEQSNPTNLAIPLTWSVEEGVLNIVFEGNTTTNFLFIDEFAEVLVNEYGFEQAVADFLLANFDRIPSRQVEVDETTISEEVTLVSAAGDRLLAWVVSRLEYRLDNTLTQLGWEGELPVGRITDTSSSQILLNADSQQSGVVAPAAGDTLALPLAYTIEDARLIEPTDRLLQHNVYTLLEGGTTSAGEFGGDPWQWTVTDAGLSLESGSEVWTYQPLATNGDVIFTLITYQVEGEVLLRTTDWIAEDDGSGASLPADLVQETPLFWNAGIVQPPTRAYLPDGRLDPEFVFGWVFREDGTATNLIVRSNLFPCFDGTAERCFAPVNNFWMWSAERDDQLVLEAGPPSERLRIWRILRYVPDGRAVVAEYLYFLFESEQFLGFPARINTVEITDLNTWPEFYDDAQFP